MEQAIDYEKVKKHRYEMAAENVVMNSTHERLIEILMDLMMKVDRLEGEK